MTRETSPDMDRLLEGTPYRALSRLASGGMGEIYEAIGADPSDKIVVKLLRSDLRSQADMVDRMRVEGEAIELLRHPNIVAWRGHGTTTDGRPYVAMERLEGITLQAELRRRGPLPLAESLHFARQLLSALRAVHGANIVHRDVKPDNVMLVRQTGRPQIKLLDFGVAKVFGGKAQVIAPLAFPTQAGACIGTPRYASPEQACGTAVDQRSDIYAAGILLYMMVAGRGPFDEIKGAGNVLRAHASEQPPPPSKFTPNPIPAALEAIILRAIAKHRADRFADAASFSRELLLTMGKMCLPVDLMATQSDIAIALGGTRTRAPLAPSPPELGMVRPCPMDPDSNLDPLRDLATVLARPGVSPSNTQPMDPVHQPEDSRAPLSGTEVLLSAAAFAIAAGGVAMWFVH